MNITEVKIKKTFAEGKTKAIISFVIDNAFKVHNVRIIETDNKRFIAMPNRKNGEKFKDIVHPIDSDNRRLMESIIFSAYDQVAEEDK